MVGKAKLLLDENVGHLVAASLMQQNFDVILVSTSTPGASDETVIKQAVTEKRIIVTLDRDFGYLVHHRKTRHAGIIYMRLQNESPENIVRALVKFSAYIPRLRGKFAKITEHHIIIR